MPTLTHNEGKYQPVNKNKIYNLHQKINLTVTAKSISVQPVSSVTAASVRADVVMAILSTVIGPLGTLIDV